MEKEKDSVADICARLHPHKKVAGWISMVPMTVTVRDDVSRGRFAVSILKDEDNREDHKEFLTTEFQLAQQQYNDGMQAVKCARRRLVRKKELADPAKKGEPQDIDNIVANMTTVDLEKNLENERSKLDKIANRQEKAQKKLEEFMDGYYSTDAKKVNQVYKDENGDFKMPWTAAPSYMKDLMPTREDPKQVYLNYKKILTHSTKEVNAEGITSVIRRFADSLDPVEFMDFRTYAFNIALDIEKRKSDPNYSRLCGLKDSSRMMRLDHQTEFHTQLMKMKDAEEFKHPFCRSVSKSIDKIKTNYLPSRQLAPFGALSKNQQQELAYIFNKKIPESRYKPPMRGNNRGNHRGRGRGNDHRTRPYDRYNRDNQYHRNNRDSRDNDFRDNRDRNHYNRDNRDGAASRGSYGRGRRDARGGRRRGRGQNQQAAHQQQADDGSKVQKAKPTKESIWKHSDTDKEAVINAFTLHDH